MLVSRDDSNQFRRRVSGIVFDEAHRSLSRMAHLQADIGIASIILPRRSGDGCISNYGTLGTGMAVRPRLNRAQYSRERSSFFQRLLLRCFYVYSLADKGERRNQGKNGTKKCLEQDLNLRPSSLVRSNHTPGYCILLSRPRNATTTPPRLIILVHNPFTPYIAMGELQGSPGTRQDH